MVKDIIFGLIDGYKGAILAFGKFEVRQKKALDYKIERLTKVNQDLRSEMIRKKNYDAFLADKVKDLKAAMNTIEASIKDYFKSSLIGTSREIVNDSFSEVTTSLEAISNDLAQTKLILESEEEEGASPSPNKPKGRVNQIEVMPFSTIKN